MNIWYSCDLGTRGGESNQGTKEAKHTILNQDVTFWLFMPVSVGGESRQAIRAGTDLMKNLVTVDNVQSIEVKAVTHKPGLIRAHKIVGRRSQEEVTLLGDLVTWCLRSGAGSNDPVFSRVTWFPNKKVPSLKMCKPS